MQSPQGGVESGRSRRLSAGFTYSPNIASGLDVIAVTGVTDSLCSGSGCSMYHRIPMLLPSSFSEKSDAPYQLLFGYPRRFLSQFLVKPATAAPLTALITQE